MNISFKQGPSIYYTVYCDGGEYIDILIMCRSAIGTYINEKMYDTFVKYPEIIHGTRVFAHPPSESNKYDPLDRKRMSNILVTLVLLGIEV